jgi:ATP-dependent Lon protease
MKEDFQAMDLPGLPLSPSNSNTDISAPVPKRKPKEVVPDPLSEVVNIDEKYREIIELKRVLIEKLRSKPNNKIVQRALDQCNRSIKKLIKHARSKNANTYEELLEQADTQIITDEVGYFKTKLSNKEQLRIMSDLREINGYMYVEKPYRLTLLQSNMPAKFKAVALQRLHQLSLMEPGDPEYFKLKNWVDNFMRIPFGVFKSLSINIKDGIDKCSDFVVKAKGQLDNCVYGLEDAKMQIMQMVGQWIANPSSMGTAIAIHGPPGTGKTSLVKDGISKILGREFAFIALGGCGDSSFLEGHSYTYEGSTWGKIAQIVMESKCMNPVIYFDELDKISDTARGQEIIGVLTHLTDTSQNNQFHDKYFSEIELDLSKCMFIFSYNDENLVNPILRDRMYRIRTKGYDLKEKMIIARNHILPKIREQVGFGPDDVVFPDDVLSHIISNQAKGEEGVRNLKRSLEIVHTKLNLYRLVKSGTQMFAKETGLNVVFPYTLTKKDVDTLVKIDNAGSSALSMMYI